MKKSLIAGVPAWALSVLTLIATIAYLVILSDLSMKRELAGQKSIYLGPLKLSEMFDFMVFFMLVPFACFFICKIHPKSFWYVPVISNALGFGMCIMMIIDSTLGSNIQISSSDVIIWGGNFVLTIVAAIIGTRIGRHRIHQMT